MRWKWKMSLKTFTGLHSFVGRYSTNMALWIHVFWMLECFLNGWKQTWTFRLSTGASVQNPMLNIGYIVCTSFSKPQPTWLMDLPQGRIEMSGCDFGSPGRFPGLWLLPVRTKCLGSCSYCPLLRWSNQGPHARADTVGKGRGGGWLWGESRRLAFHLWRRPFRAWLLTEGKYPLLKNLPGRLRD